MDKEQALKKQIIKSSESVKKKIKMMRDIQSNNEMVIDSVLKPITEPLKQMVDVKSRVRDINNEKLTPLPDQKIKRFKRKSQNQTPSSTVKKIKLFNKNSKNEDDEMLYYPDDESDNESVKNSEEEISDEENIDSLETSFESAENISPNISWSMSSEQFENIPFGVRRERKKLMMGTCRVVVNDNGITIGERTYIKIPGLIELLFKRTPNLNLITENDKLNYKAMLLDTNAHRRNYDVSKPIKSNKGLKYTNIIKPLFVKLAKNYASSESLTHGSGMSVTKKFNENIDYVYWENPNELVDRLKLLIASRDAGNMGLDNEIISIIEELRENNIIA